MRALPVAGVPPQEAERLDTEAKAQAAAASRGGQPNCANHHQWYGPEGCDGELQEGHGPGDDHLP